MCGLLLLLCPHFLLLKTYFLFITEVGKFCICPRKIIWWCCEKEIFTFCPLGTRTKLKTPTVISIWCSNKAMIDAQLSAEGSCWLFSPHTVSSLSGLSKISNIFIKLEITAIVVNPPERKLAKLTSVHCAGKQELWRHLSCIVLAY